MNNEPLVSVVLLNWNGDKYIFDCIKSVNRQDYRNIEMIIVDNNSCDGSIEKIQKKYPKYRYILNDKNFGFAKGMNCGLKYAKGKYVMPLNLDIYLETAYISKAVQIFEENPRIASVGGREFFWENKKLSNKLNEREGPSFLKKRIQYYIESHDKSQFCLAVPGSCPCFRKEALEDVKQIVGYYYDEKYETGWEDKDLFLRLFLRGWKCFYRKDIKAWHVGSSSVAERKGFLDKSLKTKYTILRNRKYLINKNLPDEILNWLKPYIILADIITPLFFYKRMIEVLRAIIKANSEYRLNEMLILEDRKKILSNQIVSVNEVKLIFRGL